MMAQVLTRVTSSKNDCVSLISQASLSSELSTKIFTSDLIDMLSGLIVGREVS